MPVDVLKEATDVSRLEFPAFDLLGRPISPILSSVAPVAEGDGSDRGEDAYDGKLLIGAQRECSPD